MKIELKQLDKDNFEIFFEMNNEMCKFLDGYELDNKVKKSLFNSAFGDNPTFGAILAYIEGRPAGFLTYLLTYSTWKAKPMLYIEDLFVIKELRGEGIGTYLFNECVKIAKKQGCVRIDWTTGKDNLKAQKFYKKMGALPTEKLFYRMREDDIKNFKF